MIGQEEIKPKAELYRPIPKVTGISRFIQWILIFVIEYILLYILFYFINIPVGIIITSNYGVELYYYMFLFTFIALFIVTVIIVKKKYNETMVDIADIRDPLLEIIGIFYLINIFGQVELFVCWMLGQAFLGLDSDTAWSTGVPVFILSTVIILYWVRARYKKYGGGLFKDNSWPI